MVLVTLRKGMVMQFRTIPLAQRQDIFFKLVTLQDAKSKGIRESKKIIIDQFQIDDATLEKITEEGMDRNWPPLSENEEDTQVTEPDINEDVVESSNLSDQVTQSAGEVTDTTEPTDEVTHIPEA